MLKERTTQLRIMLKVSPGQQEIPVSLAGRKSKMRMASGIEHRWDKMIFHSFSNNIVIVYDYICDRTRFLLCLF